MKGYRQLPDYPIANSDLVISALSTVNHPHHAKVFGIDPKDYGLTDADVKNINKKGLINHIKDGGKAPPIKFVMNYQKAMAKTCESSTMEIEKAIFMGKENEIFRDPETHIFVVFGPDKKSINGYSLSKTQLVIYKETNEIGLNYDKNK